MSTYERLHEAFPYVVEMPPEDIRKLVQELLSPDRTDVASGSSFAITVDGGTGWRLWLSNVSYEFLTRKHFNS